MKAHRFRTFVEQRFNSLLVLLLALLFIFYLAEFLHYRPYDIDNPWFLSFSYGFGVDGVRTDEFLYARFPLGMDGTHLFGKIAAFLQTQLLRHFDWQARPAQVLSAFLVTVSLGSIAAALRRLQYRATTILLFVLMAGISEPLVAASQRFRYEPVSLLLMSGGMLLATFDLLYPAMLVACLAVEVQPIAVFGVVPVVTLCLLKRPSLRGLLAIASAGATAFAVDLWLHPEFWHPLRFLAAMPHGTEHGALLGQFVYFQAPRHIPEALLPLGALLLVPTRRKYLKSQTWLSITCVAVSLLGLLFSHPNPAYMVFIYPWLILLLLEELHSRPVQVLTAALFCLFFAGQYGYAAWMNRGQGYSTADILRVRSEFTKDALVRGMNPANLSIVGDYSLWFVHPHGYHAAGLGPNPYLAGADAALCYRTPLPGLSRPPIMLCDQLVKAAPQFELASSTDVRGNRLYLYFRHATGR